jgi:hypothetical protein
MYPSEAPERIAECENSRWEIKDGVGTWRKILPVMEFKSSNSEPVEEAASTGDAIEVLEKVAKVGGGLEE